VNLICRGERGEWPLPVRPIAHSRCSIGYR
jgi:hypothetical protein